MDTQLKYRDIIKSVLQQHANHRANLTDGYDSRVLFDDERGHYIVLDIGWNGDRYLHTTPLHLDLVGDKIWIQYDDTEEGIATDLIAAGVPKENIVLGFRHPRIRQHTGFAVA
ncbi:XisI protein [Aliterella atlantica]|uniref:FdxN element excision controlling factor protein n=1 Tax=Aliterella atlantica CENA595 TaxID=1618023 RepID=A0A0D8ZS21_9CYAN|nr:XisI protein [Aliterella atlantica]KJH71530.1 FdxN element excision controlling factor protein [Aliterella atlantica CENA595]